MTDWTKTTGETGTMMIRDTGTDVEFWFKAGYSSDFYNGLQFSYTANSSTTNTSINYPTGAAWKKIGERTVTTDQTVTFKLVTDTNISGIGGPTTFSHAIDRATVPAAPSKPVISAIKNNSVVATFTDGANGGSSIDSRQIGYSTTAYVADGTIVSSDGSTTLTGLTAGTLYRVWARTHNSQGYSAWSTAATVTTLRLPDAPTTPLLSSVTSTTVDVAFSANGNGGSPITGYQIGYGTNSTSTQFIVSAVSPQVVTGLTPGTVYYFWARVQNSVGWGPWSSPASARTIAGAYILVGSVYKLAVPYVKVGGVWKIAEPWVRNVGVWKRTI